MSERRPVYTLIPRKRLEDTRGWFLKAIDGEEPGNPFACEIYFTTALPGQTRGGHYHPAAREWFTLLRGRALAILSDVRTGETSEVSLNASEPVTLFIPEGIAHVFVNCGDEEFLLAAFTDRPYDPSDTVPHPFDLSRFTEPGT